MAGEIVLTQVGNLTADPELRYTTAGLAVVNFTIATTEKVRDRDTGQWRDGETVFMRCSAWRDFAEHIAATLRKGQRVIAQGALRMRPYETREGEKRTSTELELSAIGPDLRYATATVSRAFGDGQDRNSTTPTTDWAAANAPARAATPAAQETSWATAPAGGHTSVYGDDTPF